MLHPNKFGICKLQQASCILKIIEIGYSRVKDCLSKNAFFRLFLVNEFLKSFDEMQGVKETDFRIPLAFQIANF